MCPPPTPSPSPQARRPGEPALPVARVAVDVSLAHLDRPFDYRVTPEQDAAAVPGAGSGRFAGRLRDGFVLERVATSDPDRTLAPLHKVVSAEPVLTAGRRARPAVADHYAGTLRRRRAPRGPSPARGHGEGGGESGAEDAGGRAPWPEPPPGPFGGLPRRGRVRDGAAGGTVARGRRGRSPRARPRRRTGRPGFAEAARACVEGGRTAVLLAPDQRDVARLRPPAWRRWAGPGWSRWAPSPVRPRATARSWPRCTGG